jgi:hypothetical protein
VKNRVRLPDLVEKFLLKKNENKRFLTIFESPFFPFGTHISANIDQKSEKISFYLIFT